MKISDITNQLASQVPKYTTKFCESLPYTSMVAAGGAVMVTTPNPHNLQGGALISVTGVTVKRTITSLVHDGLGNATVTVNSDHDLTLDWQPDVTLEGFTQPDFNGTFNLTDVPNRRTFVCEVSSSAPLSGTGASRKFVEHLEYAFDGTYEVTVNSNVTFTIHIANTTLTLPGVGGTIFVDQRIIGAANLDRFIDLYEKQLADHYWAVVVMDDATASKNRMMLNDSVTMGSASVDLRQFLIEPFSVFVIAPAKQDVSAETIIDVMNEEIKIALFKSLLGFIFPSGLDVDSNSGVQFYAHGFSGYYKAYYVHQFRFETVSEITLGDSVYNGTGYQPTRAFRDIQYVRKNSFGVTVMTTAINLDRIPL